MRFNWRKIYAAAIALQIVIAAYLFMTFFQGKSKVDISQEVRTIPSQEDTNDISSVGPVGLGTVEKARFVNFDKSKNLSREFGFEKLLHKQGDQWEISKPYINIHQNDFVCKLTAAKGIILTDETESHVDFSEAQLTKDVKIKIIPKKDSQIGNIDAFLNDLVFIRDRSLFITYGPVKIISKHAQLLGKGLEIVYDTQNNRLDFLKISKLQSLCVNRIQNDYFFASTPGQSELESEIENISDNTNEEKSVNKYRAVFTKNVKASTQKNLIFAKGLLAIHNILTPANTNYNQEKKSVEKAETSNELKSEDKLTDLIITCDGGLVVNPMENDIEELKITDGKDTTLDLKKDIKAEETKEIVLWSTDIDYDTQSRQAAATGPAKIKYTIQAESPNDKPGMLTVTADKVITYDHNKGLIYFKGNSYCSIETYRNDKLQKYSVKSPQLEVSFSRSQDNKDVNILKKITATGPSVVNMTVATTDSLISKSKQPNITITANKQMNYDTLTNTISFEGNCHCDILPDDEENERRYTLNSDKILVELLKTSEKMSELAAEGIKRIETKGNSIAKLMPKNSQKSLAEFSAHSIEFNQIDNMISAPGPSRLLLFSQVPQTNQKQSDSPAIITAKERASYLLDENKALFEGDCVCSIIRIDSGTPRKYNLKAPLITVDIAEDKNTYNNNQIKNITAKENAIITVTPLESTTELAKFIAANIKYNALSGILTAKGPCNFTFYANDFMPTQTLGAALPVSIKAEQSTEFLQASNQIIFKGDCLCTMERTKADFETKYTLSANTITLDLSRQKDLEHTMSALEIEKLNAQGEPVHLSTITTESNKLVGFSKLKCKSAQYDTTAKTFSAKGPGIIIVDNSRIYADQPKNNKITFTKKCYAFLRDFETLSYNLVTNRIDAQNSQNKILADYFPILENKQKQEQQQVKTSASSIKIQLDKPDGHKNEISSLKATGGITYEDADNQFIAEKMVYDAKTSLVKVDGNETQKCYLNGAVIDNIVYDINKSAVVNVDITNPGKITVP